MAMVMFKISMMGHSGNIGRRRAPVVTGPGGIARVDVIIDDDGTFIDYRDILGSQHDARIGIGITGRIRLAVAQEEISRPGKDPQGGQAAGTRVAIGIRARGWAIAFGV
jgi:hypothetical protein